MPTRILFICHGNICRSTMAQFVFAHLVQARNLSDKFVIDSCGVSDEEHGSPPHPGTKRILRAHGVPVGEHRARQLLRRDYERFDLLIGMETRNVTGIRRITGGDPSGKVCRLMDFTDRPRDIADPWYTGDFESTYRDVTEGCEALLEELTARGALD